jgi:hypothetical protein
VSVEALLACGYASFLAGSALGIDLLARHTHQRSGRFRTAGFTFHQHLDSWECPEGQHLRRVELDQQSRVVRYRGKVHICNACPSKDSCTDSDQGREIVRSLDPWPHSEAGRFHRGLSLALLTLAVLVSVAGLVRSRSAIDVAVLTICLMVALALLMRLATAFRSTPANFPAASDPVNPS